MISMSDSGLGGPGSSPGRVIVLCSGQDTLLSQCLSQPLEEYKWLPANCQGNLTKCWGVTCNGLSSHPGRVAIPLVA